jgi:hypothetical protein
VNRVQWNSPATADEVARRAGGRNRYNAYRRLHRDLRRALLWDWLAERRVNLGDLRWRTGGQARLAAELGVSRSTISRDVAALLPLVEWCGRCGYMVPKKGSSDD